MSRVNIARTKKNTYRPYTIHAYGYFQCVFLFKNTDYHALLLFYRQIFSVLLYLQSFKSVCSANHSWLSENYHRMECNQNILLISCAFVQFLFEINIHMRVFQAQLNFKCHKKVSIAMITNKVKHVRCTAMCMW